MPDEPKGSSSQVVERKLATIVSADVAGYSRLMGEDEEQTLKTFRGHKKIFESLVEMHHGRIFNTAGDAILAEFSSAVEAVRCATDIQAALRTRNDQLAPSRQVKFRMGINLGDVLVQGQDLMGDGVNVAARLQTAAEPGGICISGSVHDQIRNKLSLSFQWLGEKSFKNIQQPVRTFSITEAEGHGALPSPKLGGVGSSAAKWVAGVVVVLLAVGGGYWAYTVSTRSKAEPAHAIAAVTQPLQPASEAAKPSVVAPAAEPSVHEADATQTADKPAMKVAAPRQDTPREPAHSISAVAAVPSGVSAGKYDGTYSGQVCYGKTRIEPAQCYDAEGTIRGDKITGQWMVGADKKITMYLSGDVAASGDVNMVMQSQKHDGTVLAMIDLTGTLHGRLLDASGKFRRGRPATLNWRKKSRTSQ
ncbi:MAG: adenylate/guanylate cyclase domain-containing protein [Candidatus Acidiferrales bacterium]